MAEKLSETEGDAMTTALGHTEHLAEQNYGKLAAMTMTILKNRGWSYRQAQIATEVSFNAVERMAKGVTVETDTIVKFALAVAPKGRELGTVIEWLKAGEKNEFARLLETAMLNPDPEVVRDRAEFEDIYLSADDQHRTLARQVLAAGTTRRSRRSPAVIQ